MGLHFFTAIWKKVIIRLQTMVLTEKIKWFRYSDDGGRVFQYHKRETSVY